MVQTTEATESTEATQPDNWKQAEDQFRFLSFDAGNTLQRLEEDGWTISVNGKVGLRDTAVTLAEKHAMSIGLQYRSIRIVGGEESGLVNINVKTFALFANVEKSVRPTTNSTSMSRLAIEKMDGGEFLVLSNRAGEKIALPYHHRL